MKRRLISLIALLGFLNAAANTVYATYMVFFVIRPQGSLGPLFSRALELSKTQEGYQMLMLRRAYAAEAWQTIFQMFVFAIVLVISSGKKKSPLV